MIAASYWPRLTPTTEMSEGKDIPGWLPLIAPLCEHLPGIQTPIDAPAPGGHQRRTAAVSALQKIRGQRLDVLYQNKPLMLEASIAFIVILLSFMNDPGFYVRGISQEGIQPSA